MLKLRNILKVYILLGLCHVVVKWLRLKRKYASLARHWKHLPGKDCDVFAKIIQERVMDFNDYLTELATANPTAPLIKVPRNVPTLFCNTEESVRWVLEGEFENISKLDDSVFFVEMLKQFLGKNGIFTLAHGAVSGDHEKWRSLRATLAKIFTRNNYRTAFYSTLAAKSESLVKRIERAPSEIVDLQQLFFCFTMDAMEEMFLGKETNSIQQGLSQFGQAFDRTQEYLIATLVSSFKYDFIARLLLPFPFGTLDFEDNFSNSLVGLLFKRCSPEYKSFKTQVRRIDEQVDRYISSVKNNGKVKQSNNDIVSLILSSDSDRVTDKVLRDIVVNLTIASRDTSACALSWLFYELSSNSAVQAKLQEEVDRVVGKNTKPELEDLAVERMPYLNAVVYEALRLHPPAPRNTLITKKDLRYLDGTFIPKGTLMRSSPYAMGRKDTNYINPLKFDPERWLPFNQPNDFNFAVFQGGKRSCLGRELALLEMKIVTCVLLNSFEFTLSPTEKERISYTPGLTMAVCNNRSKTSRQLLCKVTKR